MENILIPVMENILIPVMENILILVIIIVFILAIAVGGVADSRGRSLVGWFFMSLLITPLLSVIILSLLGRTVENEAERAIAVNRIIQSKEWPAMGTDYSDINPRSKKWTKKL